MLEKILKATFKEAQWLKSRPDSEGSVNEIYSNLTTGIFKKPKRHFFSISLP